MKLLLHSPTSTTEPLKFGNLWMISSTFKTNYLSILGLRQTMSVNGPQGSYPTTTSEWGASCRHFISKLLSSYCQLASIRYFIQVNYRVIWRPLTCELHASYVFFWSWIIPLALKGNAQVSRFQLFKLHAKINQQICVNSQNFYCGLQIPCP